MFYRIKWLNRKRLNVALAVLLLLTLAIGTFQTQSQAKAADTAPSYMNNTIKDTLASDGKTLVWAGYEPGDTAHKNSNIYGKDIASGREFVIADTANTEYRPKVDGDFIIWGENDGGTSHKLMGENLVSGKKFLITSSGDIFSSWDWAVSDGVAVWVALFGDSGENIYSRNLQTLDNPVLVFQRDQINDGSAYANISLTGDTIILQTQSTGLKTCWLYAYKIGDANAGPNLIQINSGTVECNFTWTVKGNLVFYADETSSPLASYNLDTHWSGNYLTLPNHSESAGAFLVELQGASTAYSISTDGRYVVWGSTNGTSHLYTYDLTTESVFSLYLGFDDAAAIGVVSGRPILANGVLYWEQTTGPEGNKVTTIHSRPFADTLPTTMRPVPTDTTGIFYYKESGHTLVDPFKSFWEKNGGLSIFGFPFTEQMGERGKETRELFLVQYFERQRLEYHGENKGTPYEILLGRLGFAEATQRGLTGKGAFLPVPDNKQAGCKYFAVVQHTACGKFYDYWKSYGLDLGDPGLSERESLALFGYPISEVFTDPATGYQTQYFERARFELHPENAGTPYEVLLGRLAINSLVERNWLKV